MYARTISYKGQSWNLLLSRFKSQAMSQYYICNTSSACLVSTLNRHIPRKVTFLPQSWPNQCQIRQYKVGNSYLSHRLNSSKGDDNSANEDKVLEDVNEDKITSVKQEMPIGGGFANEHSRLGEQDQQEWLNYERLFIDFKKNESPFLSKRQRFKNEFLRRVIPWEKINLSLDNFPYYIDENAKSLLLECVASHLKHKSVATLYGSRLASSSGRVLLCSFPGTELYRERVMKAVARELQVSLLILDNTVIAPSKFGKESLSQVQTDGDTQSELDDDNNSSNKDDGLYVAYTADEAFDALINGLAVKDLSKSASKSSKITASHSKKPFMKGNRIKYMPKSLPDVTNQRGVSSGAMGEVFEINGDQVAVIFDMTEDKLGKASKSVDSKEQDETSFICWIDIQDLEHDIESQNEDWHAAIQALCEILPSLEPAIVYIPDSYKWLSKLVPKPNQKEFVQKLEEMLDQLTGPVVLVCGRYALDSATEEVEKYPLSLRHLAEGLWEERYSKTDSLWKLFTNALFLPFPKEEEHLRTFCKQIEEDGQVIISRKNLVELHKVLEENELSCLDFLHVKFDGLVLTSAKAEKVVGWAKNHYLSSATCPLIKGDRLLIPRESLDIAIARLRGEEIIAKMPTHNLKTQPKDEYESNFISAVVPPDEIGVKFDDIGALEDIKTTLDELVTLPMRRPELFTHGNLLSPCKGILLFGPPGTGKTLLAKALATEAGANFINITGSTLTSKWYGDAEKLTKALFSFASRLAPVIIFIDEVDSLLGARDASSEYEATRRIKNEFMAAWDGLRSKDTQRILILAATNRPFDLDDAIIRRLPRRIYVDLPNAQNRMKILRLLLSKENLEPSFNYEELANATEGYSGSDLKNLCIAAAYRPVQDLLEEEKNAGGVTSTRPSVRPLKLEDFIKAKEKVSSSVAYDATSMNELRKWNDQFGEGGSRRQTPFGFVN